MKCISHDMFTGIYHRSRKAGFDNLIRPSEIMPDTYMVIDHHVCIDTIGMVRCQIMFQPSDVSHHAVTRKFDMSIADFNSLPKAETIFADLAAGEAPEEPK